VADPDTSITQPLGKLYLPYVFGGHGHTCCQTAPSSHPTLAASYCSTYLHPSSGTIWFIPLCDGSRCFGKTMVWSLIFSTRIIIWGKTRRH